ncbi:MAG TPA: hypothetical protein PKX87_08725, partial [Alphaproteobacteria bacterium]|nr:hypothetical protein [Alphaproteobacteria bacterium]
MTPRRHLAELRRIADRLRRSETDPGGNVRKAAPSTPGAARSPDTHGKGDKREWPDCDHTLT